MNKNIFDNTDPEMSGIITEFIKEVSDKNKNLTDKEKTLIKIVALVAQKSKSLLKWTVLEALKKHEASPVEIREAVYHCAPYAGMPGTVDALSIVNEAFDEMGINMPIENQGTVKTQKERFDSGLKAQTDIFGDGMRKAAEGGPDNMDLSSYYLVTNCFGDYYTRNGLDLKTREALTLAILVNLGTEPQMKGHIAGNLNMGRSGEFISELIYQCLPYCGYPRMLNAQNCLKEVLK